ncbi:UNVERIFIED_CONTAM: hypothetical protein Scaly_2927000 [Sesamum calycinum]|uniref:Reverse transcriptase Ty1/copia-type domain-containing protein n=1 Tax=Sesamum calycinum TaxID=2727403 RepID=A0AAW2KXK8_9LAMI
MLQPPRRKARGPDAGRGRRERERSTEPLPAPRAPLLPPMERAKGKGRLEVLGRSRKLSKDEMILRLGDRKAVVAEAVGSLNLVIDDHIRIELKDCYSVPSMIKNIISIPILDNNDYAFKINKNGFYLMIDDNYHLFENLDYLRGMDSWGLTSQLDNDPKTYGEAMSDIDSDKWLEAMKSKMDSIDSNQVWTLVDPPKGIKPVVCKWVYNHKLQADGEVTAFKARLMVKG